MAVQIKTIKQKINSIKNIKKITKTMELVAVSKMKKAVSRSQASREYARYALEILVTLAKVKKIPHPLLKPGVGDKTLLLIIASNKGLCGSYNTNISKLITKYKQTIQTEMECITVGKQAEKIAQRHKFKVIASFQEFGDDFGIDEIRTLRQILIKEFLDSKKYQNVVVAYTEFIKQMQYETSIKEILPVSMKTTRKIIEEMHQGREQARFDKQSLALYLFEPDEERVLDKTIPSLLSATLFQVMLESSASEHSSRMFAMKNASDNASQLLDDLSLIYNKARQANITQEVAEIIAGAEALNVN